MLSFERVFKERMPSLMVGTHIIHVYSHFDKVKISKNCKIDEVTCRFVKTFKMGLFTRRNLVFFHYPNSLVLVKKDKFH
jgi:hypothetical protein